VTYAGAQRDLRASASPLSVFQVFLKLGAVSFGGPIAHLGYFRSELVERRRWLDAAAYAQLVALCQLLPGPTSSQVGMAIGLRRAGLAGAAAAWLGFTLPSALLMIAFGYGLHWFGDAASAGWLHGLKLAAVAIVAQAVWTMAVSLCPDRPRIAFAVCAAVLLLFWQTGVAQLIVIAGGALLGRFLLSEQQSHANASEHIEQPLSKSFAQTAGAVFLLLLVGLPLLARLSASHAVALLDSFYRTGALVFGGGHVVLPLLRAQIVPPGWISDADFLAGYGAAQALPGPLFSFAAYLGNAMQPPPSGIAGAALCLVALFLPGFLLVVTALPYWDALQRRTGVRRALQGVNAAVVGILLAALFDPIWVSAVQSRGDFAVALAAFALLVFWRLPPVAIVALCAISGQLLVWA